MESSVHEPESNPSTQEEEIEAEEEDVKVFQLQAWLHVASQRSRRVFAITQTLKELVEAELESSNIEVHWLDEAHVKRRCSWYHRHSDVTVTFECRVTAPEADQLITELKAIGQSVASADYAVRLVDAQKSEAEQ